MTRSGSAVRKSWFSKNEQGRFRVPLIIAVTTILTAGMLGTVGVVLAHAQGASVPAVTRQKGTLKVCKVAGMGFPLNDLVAVSMTPPPLARHPEYDVKAGPAPGGYCVIDGSQYVGTKVTFTETPYQDPQSQATSITTNASGQVTTNLAARKITLTVGTGVTEVTFTDASKQSGFLEICKQLTFTQIGLAAPALFDFTVSGNPSFTVAVPGGECSSAINLPVGTYTVTETTGPSVSSIPFLPRSCSTIPAARLVVSTCTAVLNTVSPPAVKVVAGGISSETVLTITNLICSPAVGCPV